VRESGSPNRGHAETRDRRTPKTHRRTPKTHRRTPKTHRRTPKTPVARVEATPKPGAQRARNPEPRHPRSANTPGLRPAA